MSAPRPLSLRDDVDELGERLSRVEAVAGTLRWLATDARPGVQHDALAPALNALERDLRLAIHDTEALRERLAEESGRRDADLAGTVPATGRAAARSHDRARQPTRRHLPRARGGRSERAHAHRRRDGLRSRPGRSRALPRRGARAAARAAERDAPLPPAPLEPGHRRAELAGVGGRRRRSTSPATSAGRPCPRRAERTSWPSGRGSSSRTASTAPAAVGDGPARGTRRGPLGAREQDPSLHGRRCRLGRRHPPAAGSDTRARAARSRRRGPDPDRRRRRAHPPPGRPAARRAIRRRRAPAPLRAPRRHPAGPGARRAAAAQRAARGAAHVAEPADRHAPALRLRRDAPRRRAG